MIQLFRAPPEFGQSYEYCNSWPTADSVERCFYRTSFLVMGTDKAPNAALVFAPVIVAVNFERPVGGFKSGEMSLSTSGAGGASKGPGAESVAPWPYIDSSDSGHSRGSVNAGQTHQLIHVFQGASAICSASLISRQLSHSGQAPPFTCLRRYDGDKANPTTVARSPSGQSMYR